MIKENTQSRVDELSALMAEIMTNPLKPLREQISNIESKITQSSSSIRDIKTEIKNVINTSDEILEQENRSYREFDKLGSALEQICKSHEIIRHAVDEISLAEKSNENQFIELKKQIQAYEQHTASTTLESIQNSNKILMQHQSETIAPLIENVISLHNNHSEKQNVDAKSIVDSFQHQLKQFEEIQQSISKTKDVYQNHYLEFKTFSSDVLRFHTEHSKLISELLGAFQNANHRVDFETTDKAFPIEIKNLAKDEPLASKPYVIESSSQGSEGNPYKVAPFIESITLKSYPYLIWIVIVFLIMNSALTAILLSR